MVNGCGGKSLATDAVSVLGGRCLTLTERLYQSKKQYEVELEKINDLIKDLEAAPELQKVLDKLQSANIRY